MMVAILSTWFLMILALATASSDGASSMMSSARTDATFIGVPSSWAMPAASRPTVVSRSACRSCSRRGNPGLGLGVHLIASGGQLIAHHVEGGGQLREFVVAGNVEGPVKSPVPTRRVFSINRSSGLPTTVTPQKCDHKSACRQHQDAHHARSDDRIVPEAVRPSSE